MTCQIIVLKMHVRPSNACLIKNYLATHTQKLRTQNIKGPGTPINYQVNFNRIIESDQPCVPASLAVWHIQSHVELLSLIL